MFLLMASPLLPPLSLNPAVVLILVIIAAHIYWGLTGFQGFKWFRRQENRKTQSNLPKATQLMVGVEVKPLPLCSDLGGRPLQEQQQGFTTTHGSRSILMWVPQSRDHSPSRILPRVEKGTCVSVKVYFLWHFFCCGCPFL